MAGPSAAFALILLALAAVVAPALAQDNPEPFGLSAESLDAGLLSTSADVVAAATILPLPQFTITDLRTSPAFPSATSKFSAIVTVKNIGFAATNKTKVKIWTNEATPQNCSTAGGSAKQAGVKIVSIPVLLPNELVSITVKGLSVSDTTPKTLQALVDFDCKNSQVSTTTSQKTSSYTPNNTLADLWLQDVSGAGGPNGFTQLNSPVNAPVYAVAGGKFDVTLYVSNQGSAKAKIGNVKVFLAANSTPSFCNATGDFSKKINTVLTPGAYKSIKIKGIPSPAAVGTYNGYVAIDGDCTVSEVSETNNLRKFSYTGVAEALPEFALELPSFKVVASVGNNKPPVNATAGNFAFKIKNIGLAPGAVKTVGLLANRGSVNVANLVCANVTGSSWIKSAPKNNKIPVGGTVSIKINAVRLPTTYGTITAVVYPDALCETNELFATQEASTATWTLSPPL